MIEILYLFLIYLPFSVISITHLTFIISNNYYFSILPLVVLYHLIVPYPFYYDVIAILSNYVVCVLFELLRDANNYRYSKFIKSNISFLSNYFSLFIVLGFEYIWRFDNIFDSIFGLFLFSMAYLYYPFLHRLYFGQNNRTWKRKIDYYYSYYKEGYQYYYVLDILEGLLLGLLTIFWYNGYNDIEYFYIGMGLLKIIYHIYKPISYNTSCLGKYYFMIQYVFILFDIGLVFLNKYGYDFVYMFMINGIFQLTHNIIILNIAKPNQYRLIIRESISLPDIYFNS